jgi:cytochrome c oxidase subunit 5b
MTTYYLQNTILTYFICPHIEIKVEDDLIPPGGKPGTIPTDLDQATGLERLELIGKMQGIDIFDMRPLDASRKGMFP